MAFNKENASVYGKLAVKMKAEYAKDRMEYVVSGGLNKALAIMDGMLDGEKPTREQIKAIELIKDFMPYKKARKTDITTDGKELQPVLVTFLKDE